MPAERMNDSAASRRFTKMHGAGNDFVVLDLRDGAPAPDRNLCRLLADRHFGVGCDQLLTIEPPENLGAIAGYRIWNADGSSSRQCGNGARCVAHFLRRHDPSIGDRFTLDSPAGPIEVKAIGDSRYTLDMGKPDFSPERIGLRLEGPTDPYVITLDHGPISFGAVSMGNPHAVLEVSDLDHAQVERLGRALQGRSEFADGVNVGFAQVVSPERIRLRVFERGVGETLACGSAACAAVAVLIRRGRVEPEVSVELPGGTLHIAWPGADAAIAMTGPAAFVFDGELCHPFDAHNRSGAHR